MEYFSSITYSIIVPVYNVEEYLSECMDSILAQDSPSICEIILVDDGSTDNSGTICDDYAGKYTNIRVLHTENHGLSCARNAGIDIAHGEYILFLDSDDLWAQGILTTLDAFLKYSPDMVAFCLQKFDSVGRGEIIQPQLFPMIGETGMQYFRRCLNSGTIAFNVSACAWLYSKDFIDRHEFRFSPGKVYEDFEFNMHCLPVAQTIYATDTVCYYYRHRLGSISKAPSIDKRYVHDQMLVKWFRQYPCASLANYYTYSMLAFSKLGNCGEVQMLVDFYRKNQDVLNYVTGVKLQFARLMFRIFGFYNGSKIVMSMIDLRNRLRGIYKRRVKGRN